MTSWTVRRERHLKTWAVQMAKAAILLDRSSSLLRYAQFAVTLLGQFCTVYTSIIPVATLGCVLVGSDTCSQLQISGIVAAVIGSMTALMDSKISLSSMAKDMSLASKQINQLARKIDLQLQRSESHREPIDAFADGVAAQYDEIMNSVPELPRFVFKREDLVNLTLLSAYIEAPNTVEQKELDDVLCEKIAYEMERFNSL